MKPLLNFSDFFQWNSIATLAVTCNCLIPGYTDAFASPVGLSLQVVGSVPFHLQGESPQFLQAQIDSEGYSCIFVPSPSSNRNFSFSSNKSYILIHSTTYEGRIVFSGKDVMMSCSGADLTVDGVAQMLANRDDLFIVDTLEPEDSPESGSTESGNFPFGSTLTEKTETKISAGNFPFVEESNSKSVNTGEVKTESSTSTLTSGCELNDRVTTALDQGLSDRKFFKKFGVEKNLFVKNGSCWVNSLVLGASNQITSSDDKTITQELHASGEDEAKKDEAKKNDAN